MRHDVTHRPTCKTARLANGLKTDAIAPRFFGAVQRGIGVGHDRLLVATLQGGQDERSLIAAADAALYRAKEAGRDRIAT